MNVIAKVLLLAAGLFSFSACGALRPVDNVYGDTSAAKESPDTALRKEVTKYAQEFLGSPYKYAGKTPSSGFDCSGFTGYVMKQHGIQLSASSRYQEKDGKKIAVDEAKPGDLIFFRRSKTGTVFHVALVISNDKNGLVVIHSTSKRGVVKENIRESSYWRSKYATACDVIGARQKP